jgi:hypothetical protein
MKKLLQTMAAVVLAASIVPIYAQENTQPICNTEACEQERETVDSAAAWAFGLTRAAGTAGALSYGLVKAVALQSYVPFVCSFVCSHIWAYWMDNYDHIFGINKATRSRAAMIGSHIGGCAILGVGVTAAFGAVAQNYYASLS